jgi:hypothetical protein
VPILGNGKAFFILLLILCFVLVSFPIIGIVKAEAKTIVVPDDYTTIQEAIDNAAAGDTIYEERHLPRKHRNRQTSIFDWRR